MNSTPSSNMDTPGQAQVNCTPTSPLPDLENLHSQPLVLVETDMLVEPHHVTSEMWQKAGTEQIDELYTILKHGYAGASTSKLYANVPFTRSGKFAFTATGSRGDGHARGASPCDF